jgi:hypothetical protein
VPPLAILAGLFLDRLLREGPEEHLPALLLGLAAFAVVGHGLWVKPRAFSDLFVYRYDRPWPERELADLHPAVRLGPFAFSMQPRAVLTVLLSAGGASLVLGGIWRSARWMVASLGLSALVLAGWLSWFHWRDLSPHWTQRELFRAWEAERGSPDEPLVAWYMNWRGETFYGRNRVRDVMEERRLAELARRPGRLWVITERGRDAALRAELGPGRRPRLVASNNKYELVEVVDAEGPGATP